MCGPKFCSMNVSAHAMAKLDAVEPERLEVERA